MARARVGLPACGTATSVVLALIGAAALASFPAVHCHAYLLVSGGRFILQHATVHVLPAR